MACLPRFLVQTEAHVQRHRQATESYSARAVPRLRRQPGKGNLPGLLEPPFTDPYARWCGEDGEANNLASHPIAFQSRRKTV
jgi:hypothetical protein